MTNDELQIELGPGCGTMAFAPEQVLELGDSFLGARSPFLPAGLVCSVVLGLNLRAGPGAAADTPVDSFRL